MATANTATKDWELALQATGDHSETNRSGAATRKRFSLQDRVDLTSQLAMMIGAGVSLSSALKSMIKQSRRQTIVELLRQISDDLHGGMSLSKAMAKHPAMFDAAYLATVAAGEASGKMADVLDGLAQLLRSEASFIRTLRGMLVYPLMLMCVSTGVITTLIIFVLPRFADIFEQYELTLPLITSLLLGVADELQNRWWLWGALVAGGMTSLVMLFTTASGRAMLDHALLKTPVLKDVTQRVIGARACKLMGLLVSSGVPLLDCITLLKRAIPNVLFQQLADKMNDTVTNGHSLSEAFEDNEVLPESASEMIATAEKTGRLGEVASALGSHYEEEGRESARQLASAIEPILTIAMGAVVAVVVLAVMLPVFDIASLAQ